MISLNNMRTRQRGQQLREVYNPERERTELESVVIELLYSRIILGTCDSTGAGIEHKPGQTCP